MSSIARLAVTLIHGENPRNQDIILTHLAGIMAGVFLLWQNLSRDAGLSVLQSVVLFILAWDSVGGVISNCTRATSMWYMKQPVQIRFLFIGVHFVHPLIAVTVLDPGNWALFAVLYLTTLISASVILLVRDVATQRPLAAAFFLLGVLIVQNLASTAPVLQWLPVVYFLKLIVCFSVDHYSARENMSPQQVG